MPSTFFTLRVSPPFFTLFLLRLSSHLVSCLSFRPSVPVSRHLARTPLPFPRRFRRPVRPAIGPDDSRSRRRAEAPATCVRAFFRLGSASGPGSASPATPRDLCACTARPRPPARPIPFGLSPRSLSVSASRLEPRSSLRARSVTDNAFKRSGGVSAPDTKKKRQRTQWRNERRRKQNKTKQKMKPGHGTRSEPLRWSVPARTGKGNRQKREEGREKGKGCDRRVSFFSKRPVAQPSRCVCHASASIKLQCVP